nr:immunoglobulin heavy chain junction region [Macaca mulatta]MOY26933.1 immunoglobulin heavy chain junction region [Macaca mulatta]
CAGGGSGFVEYW